MNDWRKQSHVYRPQIVNSKKRPHSPTIVPPVIFRLIESVYASTRKPNLVVSVRILHSTVLIDISVLFENRTNRVLRTNTRTYLL